SGRDGAPKDYYTLESVVYLLRNIDLQHVQYVRQAANAKVPAVLLPDRKDLLAYLTGEANTAPSIDRAAPVDISLRRSVAKRQPSELLPHLRRDGNDLSGAEAFTHDSEAKRARLIAANDENVDNVTVQAASKSMQIDEDSIARKQRRLASNLDALLAGRGSSLMANDQAKSSSLTEAIPIDQIEALRAKYLATQQQRIKTDDIDRMLEASVPTSAPSVVPSNDSNASAVPGSVLLRGTRPGLHSSALSGEQQSIIRIDDTVSTQPYTDSSVPRAALVADEAAVRAIVTRERRWRTRVSVLQSQGKTFYENIVLGILRNVIPLAVGASYAKPALGSTNYTNTGSAMAISTGQHGICIIHVMIRNGSPAAVRRLPAFASIPWQRIMAKRWHPWLRVVQIPVRSRTTHLFLRLRVVRRGATGSETPLPYQEPPGPRDPRGFGSGVPMTPSATPDAYRGLRSTADARLAARNKARSSRIPIIIIPAAPTSLITMYNARDILQDLRYITSQEKQASGVRRENEILIHRQKPDGRSVPYRVVDQPHKLQPDEWNRVVAVFVQGQAWQFKGWPIGSDPAVIFSMIKGFHLKHTNKPLDVNVAKWNVRVINLDQRRHLDKANFQLIWDQLDKHIAKCKPFLRS
ncbi:Parafibromin, partial [Fasciola gigantica]